MNGFKSETVLGIYNTKLRYLHLAKLQITPDSPPLGPGGCLGPEERLGVVLLLDLEEFGIDGTPEGVLPVWLVDVTLEIGNGY